MNGRISDAALTVCYVASTAVIVALYREPLAALARDIGRTVIRPHPVQSVRHFGGRLWRDVNEAIDNA